MECQLVEGHWAVTVAVYLRLMFPFKFFFFFFPFFACWVVKTQSIGPTRQSVSRTVAHLFEARKSIFHTDQLETV